MLSIGILNANSFHLKVSRVEQSNNGFNTIVNQILSRFFFYSFTYKHGKIGFLVPYIYLIFQFGLSPFSFLNLIRYMSNRFQFGPKSLFNCKTNGKC